MRKQKPTTRVHTETAPTGWCWKRKKNVQKPSHSIWSPPSRMLCQTSWQLSVYCWCCILWAWMYLCYFVGAFCGLGMIYFPYKTFCGLRIYRCCCYFYFCFLSYPVLLFLLYYFIFCILKFWSVCENCKQACIGYSSSNFILINWYLSYRYLKTSVWLVLQIVSTLAKRSKVVTGYFWKKNYKTCRNILRCYQDEGFNLFKI